MVQGKTLALVSMLALTGGCDALDDLTGEDDAGVQADASSTTSPVSATDAASGTTSGDAGSATGDAGSAAQTAVLPPTTCGAPAGLIAFKASNLPLVVGLTSQPAFTDTPFATNCTINTDSLAWDCGGYGPPKNALIRAVSTPAGELAVLYVESFTLPVRRSIAVVGQRPFALLTDAQISISGSLYTASSSDNGYASAGAPGASRPERKGFGSGGGSAGSAQLGGGGGSFCGRGGAPTGGGASPEPYGNPELIPLLGGSSGGSAWSASAAAGGALQLTAGKSLTISETGTISAPGYSAGGYSGGSSGGGILLEAPELVVLGTLAANGGGGGDSIYRGAEGTVTNTPAAGGGDSGRQSPSGGGAAGSHVDGFPGLGANGAGGGGSGRIRLNSVCPLQLGSNSVITPNKGTACYSEGLLSAR